MDVLIVVVGIVCCTYLLSRTDIKITIKHAYPDPPVDVEVPTTQATVDKIQEEAKIPTFDDVLAAVHEILGGEDDAD